MKIAHVIVAALFALPAFGIQKCTAAGGQVGLIGHETQLIPNFKGKLVPISVEYCVYKGGKSYSGYHYSAMTVKPTFSGNVGANCRGPICMVPKEGIDILRQLQAQTDGAEGLQLEGKSMSATLSRVLAQCPPEGECEIPAGVMQSLNAQVKVGAEALQMRQQANVLSTQPGKAISKPGIGTR